LHMHFAQECSNHDKTLGAGVDNNKWDRYAEIRGDARPHMLRSDDWRIFLFDSPTFTGLTPEPQARPFCAAGILPLCTPIVFPPLHCKNDIGLATKHPQHFLFIN
jgi:hypothetical protein